MVPGKVRIIAGEWRRRKLDVVDATGLRPTPDRVRETLFNWLAPHIEGAHCLDLYAGTGILGFESLSRGAATATLVDSNPAVVKMLETQAKKLETDSAEIICTDARQWMKHNRKQFDIVFLDPPYSKNELAGIVAGLLESGMLRRGALLYIESDGEFSTDDPRLSCLKSGQAGVVNFRLFEYSGS
ncbi:MAG: 16S rRNA (guanine(966)-N(2))-methyltransferase RsmD [Gammaproteobacteria bacterium]